MFQKLNEEFLSMDTDNNGTISQGEFIKAMKKTTSLTFGVGVVGQKEQRKSKNNRS